MGINVSGVRLHFSSVRYDVFIFMFSHKDKVGMAAYRITVFDVGICLVKHRFRFVGRCERKMEIFHISYAASALPFFDILYPDGAVS